MRYRLAALALGLVVAGCGPSRLVLDPTPSAVTVAVSEVEAGDGLYPFVSRAGRWGYMDSVGQVVLAPAYDSADPFSEGRAAVRVGEAYGYIDPDGQLVVPARFASAAAYSQGRALVTEGPLEDRRFGFIDPEGSVVIPLVMALAYSYSEGLALVRFRERRLTLVERVLGAREDRLLSFVDRDGRVVFTVPGEAASFSEGLAPFSEPTIFDSGKWGYVRSDGSVAIPAAFGRAAFRFSDGRARVVSGGDVGFIDTSGQVVFGQTYDVAHAFSEGRAAVQVGDRWGYLDPSGALVIEPRFERAGAFSGGLAAVQQGGRWGFVGPDGQLAIEPAYTAAQAFRGALALVTDGSGTYYIDRQGQAVRPPTL